MARPISIDHLGVLRSLLDGKSCYSIAKANNCSIQHISRLRNKFIEKASKNAATSVQYNALCANKNTQKVKFSPKNSDIIEHGEYVHIKTYRKIERELNEYKQYDEIIASYRNDNKSLREKLSKQDVISLKIGSDITDKLINKVLDLEELVKPLSSSKTELLRTVHAHVNELAQLVDPVGEYYNKRSNDRM